MFHTGPFRDELLEMVLPGISGGAQLAAARAADPRWVEGKNILDRLWHVLPTPIRGVDATLARRVLSTLPAGSPAEGMYVIGDEEPFIVGFADTALIAGLIDARTTWFTSPEELPTTACVYIIMENPTPEIPRGKVYIGLSTNTRKRFTDPSMGHLTEDPVFKSAEACRSRLVTSSPNGYRIGVVYELTGDGIEYKFVDKWLRAGEFAIWAALGIAGYETVNNRMSLGAKRADDSRPVVGYDPATGRARVFRTLKYAASQTEAREEVIVCVVGGHQDTSGGLYWRFATQAETERWGFTTTWFPARLLGKGNFTPGRTPEREIWSAGNPSRFLGKVPAEQPEYTSHKSKHPFRGVYRHTSGDWYAAAVNDTDRRSRPIRVPNSRSADPAVAAAARHQFLVDHPELAKLNKATYK